MKNNPVFNNPCSALYREHRLKNMSKKKKKECGRYEINDLTHDNIDFSRKDIMLQKSRRKNHF